MPGPLDAEALVPPVIYDSPFSRYRTSAEQEVAPWRQTNDTAGRIGGWRAYAREAREPESGSKARPPAVMQAPGTTAKPKPGDDDHHPATQGGRHDSH